MHGIGEGGVARVGDGIDKDMSEYV